MPRCLQDILGTPPPPGHRAGSFPTAPDPLLRAWGLQSRLHVLPAASEGFLFLEVSSAENLTVLVAAVGLEALSHPDSAPGCWDGLSPDKPRRSRVSLDPKWVLPR